MADVKGKVNVVNEGFWGINAVSGDEYILKFYVRGNNTYKGNITASLQSADGSVLASHTFANVTNSA